MRELGLWETETEIDKGFEDVVAIAASCRFGDCRHVTEPGCAIREALETGGLSWSAGPAIKSRGRGPTVRRAVRHAAEGAASDRAELALVARIRRASYDKRSTTTVATTTCVVSFVCVLIA